MFLGKISEVSLGKEDVVVQVLVPLQVVVVHFSEEHPLTATATLPVPPQEELEGIRTDNLMALVICDGRFCTWRVPWLAITHSLYGRILVRATVI